MPLLFYDTLNKRIINESDIITVKCYKIITA